MWTARPAGRGRRARPIASNPPYGYVKDPQNKKKWIVDEESAKVVRRIFDLCIVGKGPMQIAKILTADRVLTVTAYNARQKGWAMPDNLYRWCAKSVAPFAGKARKKEVDARLRC